MKHPMDKWWFRWLPGKKTNSGLNRFQEKVLARQYWKIARTPISPETIERARRELKRRKLRE